MIRQLLCLSAVAGSLYCHPLFTSLSASLFTSALDSRLPVAYAAAGEGQPDSAGDRSYRQGRTALENNQWDQAIAAFSDAVAKNSSSSDAALYWKAYAQSHSGRKQEALATVAELRRRFASSRWLEDARILEVEINAQAGVPVNPSSEQNDDIKLMALNSLMTSEPRQALPILERILKSSNSPRLKERALFVLTQNPTPEARKILVDTARGNTNPDLQRAAIRYIGMLGSEDARSELASLYQSTSDHAVKKEVLQGLMISGSRAQLLKLAQSEKDPDLQHQAIRQLAIAGGQEELWQLYKTNIPSEQKQEILKAMFVGGNSDRLVEVVRSERDPALRAAAIKSLGLMGSHGQSDVLVSVYRSDQSHEIRDAVLNALFIQQNGSALVSLARAESDPEWKKRIISKLALVHTKEATDYMMEILK